MWRRSPVCVFVVGADLVFAQILHDRRPRRVGARGLDAAAFDLDDLVRPLLEKSGDRPVFSRCGRVLRLIPVSLAGFRPGDLHALELLPAQPVQRIRHALRLEFALGGIVQMPEIAAAALLGIGAQAIDTVRRARYNLLDPAVCGVFPDVDDAKLVFLVRRGVRHKHGAALHAANAQPLAGEARDGSAVDFVLFQHSQPHFVSRETVFFRSVLYHRKSALQRAFWRNYGLSQLHALPAALRR